MAKKRKDAKEAYADALAVEAKAGVEAVSPMSQMERGTEAWVRQLAQAEMDRKLAALAPEDGRPQACPRCGHKAPVRRKDVARTFQSLWGTHTLVRHLHYCETCRAGFAPRDVELGLPQCC